MININHNKFDSFLPDIALLNSISIDDNTVFETPEKTLHDEPLIKFVDQMLQIAIEESTSDIHIEPYEKSCRIRYRCHSILINKYEISHSAANRLGIRLKVLSKLDITERRLSQDGRFQWQGIDIRISTCPIQHGEKIVLRILDIKKQALDINCLGFNTTQKKLFLQKISAPQGLILVTGPTGSGKSFTLYSALNYLNTIEKNISTVEDPIEIQLSGVNQVNINPKIHFDFSAAVRALLRQDPDIIMIGEIRDKETAEIAIQAADTGHLVLATLHTKDSIEAINRLSSMHIPLHRILNVLTLVVSQRLIRLLCPQCKQLKVDEAHSFYHAVGCQFCFNGYQGRTGVYELFCLNDQLAELFTSNASKQTIRTHAEQTEFISLYQSGIQKWQAGLTSLDELHRVLPL